MIRAVLLLILLTWSESCFCWQASDWQYHAISEALFNVPSLQSSIPVMCLSESSFLLELPDLIQYLESTYPSLFFQLKFLLDKNNEPNPAAVRASQVRVEWETDLRHRVQFYQRYSRSSPALGERITLFLVTNILSSSGFKPYEFQLVYFRNRRGILFLTQWTSVPKPHLPLHEEPNEWSHWLLSSSFETKSDFDAKLLTYNVWNFAGPAERYSARMNAILEQIRDSDAHIITLQEVRYSNHEHPCIIPSGSPSCSHCGHQLEDILSQLPGYQFVYLPAMSYIDDTSLVPDVFEEHKRLVKHTDEGLAILSKWPIVKVNSMQLSRNYSDEVDAHHRLVLHAQVLHPSGAIINVFTTHASLSETGRKRNAIEMAYFIQSMSSSNAISVLSGDLNEEEDGILNSILRNETSLVAANVACEDVISPSEAKQNWTFTTLYDKPKKRIDFWLLCAGKDRVNYFSASTIENTKYQSALVPSDHRAVLLVLNLNAHL